MAGAVGNNPTKDSFSDNLDLERFGSPKYSADFPPRGPSAKRLWMAFANEGLGGPAFPGFYGRDDSLSMVEQGFALEAWVKAGPTDLDSIRNSLIAYNGQPDSNGFGLFLHGEDYVARIGSFERSLGTATIGEWHHLAYVQSLGSAAYYYDGKLVHETTSDPLPVAAEGGFSLGGVPIGMNEEGRSCSMAGSMKFGIRASIHWLPVCSIQPIFSFGRLLWSVTTTRTASPMPLITLCGETDWEPTLHSSTMTSGGHTSDKPPAAAQGPVRMPPSRNCQPR